MQHNIPHTLLLNLLNGVGPSRYWSYVDYFGSAEKVVCADPQTLPKLSRDARKALTDYQLFGERSDLARRALTVLEAVDAQGANLLTHQDQDYPTLLQQIPQPPPLLFVKGNTDLLSLPQLAIVGTRHPTQTGIENTNNFSRYLAGGGFTITSGLALGIDGVAHKAALTVGGHTLAVMATGIDQVYPYKHRDLAEDILANGGLLMTEYLPGTPPRATNFPRRNRIISGLSSGVLVVEAAIKSGSLITARYALEQNREIFAIPGSIHNPQAKGCHELIKEGAQLVESGEDIIKQLAGIIQVFEGQILQQKNNASPKHTKELPDKEQRIIKSIGYDAVSIEEIIERTGLSSAEVTSNLLNLELKGLVKHSGWGYEAVHSLSL